MLRKPRVYQDPQIRVNISTSGLSNLFLKQQINNRNIYNAIHKGKGFSATIRNIF